MPHWMRHIWNSEARSSFSLKPVALNENRELGESLRRIEISHPSAVFEKPQVSIDSLSTTSQGNQIIGNLRVSGSIQYDTLELLTADVGIQLMTFLNGSVEVFDRIDLPKPAGINAFTHRAEFTFLRSVPLQPGWNSIMFRATHPYGLNREMSVHFEIHVTLPEDPEYATGYAQCKLGVGEVTDAKLPGEADFRPFALELIGDDLSNCDIREIIVGDAVLSAVKIDGRTFLSRKGQRSPEAFLMLHLSDRNYIGLPPMASITFDEAFAEGLFSSGLRLISSEQTISSLSWRDYVTAPPICTVVRGTRNGKSIRYRNDLPLPVEWRHLGYVADVARKVILDDDAIVLPVLISDLPILNALSAEFSDAFAYSFEMLRALADEAAESDSPRMGRFAGLILKETMRAIRSTKRGKSLKSDIMTAVIKHFETHSYGW